MIAKTSLPERVNKAVLVFRQLCTTLLLDFTAPVRLGCNIRFSGS